MHPQTLGPLSRKILFLQSSLSSVVQPLIFSDIARKFSVAVIGKSLLRSNEDGSLALHLPPLLSNTNKWSNTVDKLHQNHHWRGITKHNYPSNGKHSHQNWVQICKEQKKPWSFLFDSVRRLQSQAENLVYGKVYNPVDPTVVESTKVLNVSFPPLQVVQIYFDTSTYDEIEKDQKVTLEAQLGVIGGTMGLLTGFSILSGVEIIYFALKLFMRIIQNKQIV